jgi:hypothetical protein
MRFSVSSSVCALAVRANANGNMDIQTIAFQRMSESPGSRLPRGSHATQNLLIRGYRFDRLTQRSYCGCRREEDDQLGEPGDAPKSPTILARDVLICSYRFVPTTRFCRIPTIRSPALKHPEANRPPRVSCDGATFLLQRPPAKDYPKTKERRFGYNRDWVYLLGLSGSTTAAP